MSDELRAARERLRRLRNGESYASVYGMHEVGGGFRQRDEQAVIDNNLAEHPSDGATPASTEWIRESFGPLKMNVSFKRPSMSFATLPNLLVLYWCPPCGNLPPCVCIESFVLIDNPTREQVRNLARCLGITLREVP